MKGFRRYMEQMMFGGRGGGFVPQQPMLQQRGVVPSRDAVGALPMPGYGRVGATMDGTAQPQLSQDQILAALNQQQPGLGFPPNMPAPGLAGFPAGPGMPLNWTGCIQPVYPLRAADKFCPMVIPLDTEAHAIAANATVCFEIELECIFRLCTLRIPSKSADCLVVTSIVVRRTEQLGCGGSGEGAVSGTFFSELATCCYCVACDVAWPGDNIKVCVRNIGNAAIGDPDTDTGKPGLVALIGEGLEFSDCFMGLFPATNCY